MSDAPLGISSLPAESDAAVDGGPTPVRTGSTFTVHLVRMAGFGLVILAVATALAVIWPAPLGDRPIPGTETTKPMWMFLPFYPLEDWFGLPALIWGPMVALAALALAPSLDRSPYRSFKRRKFWVVAGVAFAILLIAFVAIAAIQAPASHLGKGM